MEIAKRKTDDIIPYKNNPRKNDGAVDAVAESIRQCGYCAPIIVDENGVILAGHTRLKAIKKLGWSEVEVCVKSGLTEKQKKKFRILDNKTTEFAEWDFDALQVELDGMDFEGFNFELECAIGAEGKGYTGKVNIPQYEITGENPSESELVDTEKAEQLIAEIEIAQIPQDVKKFLKIAAARHNVFDYQKIAEYYAHASKEIQELMEKSALVIIDYENAIANGYVRIASEIAGMIEEDSE